ncbi:probable serine/threonine-protein kinase PBL25 [Rutidosis leptorrhynchoides]|uniref:probable serine/threonine-protein kinase PBL25 n=1 Tax=Rutidosis leptorrhynchoides TaxID=125765 RepID=UPI003A9A2071
MVRMATMLSQAFVMAKMVEDDVRAARNRMEGYVMPQQDQENNKDALKISLENIQLATENFHDKNFVGGGGFGKVYKGKLPHSDNTIVAKRLDTKGGQGEKQFRNELQIRFNFKHDNIISLVGYCDEKDAKIIVYEYAIRGSLDGHLKDSHLTWMKRLNICIDIATALDFLHGGDETLATVIHRDIKPDKILLSSDWKAKLGDFGLSLTSVINNETDFVIDHACGTEGYVDPLYMKSRFLTKESDIYCWCGFI